MTIKIKVFVRAKNIYIEEYEVETIDDISNPDHKRRCMLLDASECDGRVLWSVPGFGYAYNARGGWRQYVLDNI